jgi:SAM-dependent methyltransferase
MVFANNTPSSSEIAQNKYAAAQASAQGDKALKLGQIQQALQYFLKAVRLDSDDILHKHQLCYALCAVNVNSHHPQLQEAVISCLRAKGIHYQNFWRAWFSMLMADPSMSAFVALMNGKDYKHEDLMACLDNSFLTLGMERMIIYDMRFENAMRILYKNMQEGISYPSAFLKAFDTYCRNTEYVFCDDQPKALKYEVDMSIPSLSTPREGVSRSVASMYEENPYPRWMHCHMQEKPANPHAKPYNQLVAGCGTGYATCQMGVLFPHANITAIDISRASLTYAKGKAQEMGLKNITFYQADILDLGALNQDFDLIDCSGVLHHMENPEEGWKCLLKKLRPEGRMHIGLYSELGRQDIVAARAYIAEKGFKSTVEGIKQARLAITALPDAHPARAVLARRDFYSMSGCRDLIFHVQEHRFTIDRLRKALEALGLQFNGFNLQAPDIAPKYAARFPDDPAKTNLDNWEAFETENPDSFRGMYQFWCTRQKKA